MSEQFEVAPIIAIVQKAGALVEQMRRDGSATVKRSKSSVIDLVTEADLASEAFLRKELHALYPHVGFWGEESNQRPTEAFFWLVDPIDGTTNFANGLPFYAVNVALCQGDGALIGVTLHVPAGIIYWSERGRGAYQRGTDGIDHRLQVNGATELNRALVGTGFPYHRRESTDNNSAELAYFIPLAQSIRCQGAAALDLAMVATGALAVFWEGWLGPWDAAAGTLLIREAGGRITDYAGTEWTLPGGRGLIASNGQPALHDAVLTGIRTARATLTDRRLPL